MPTCGQASSMRAMPENEIPPAPPGDHYCFFRKKRDLKGAGVNEAPVGLQSRAPTKRERESNPVAPTKDTDHPKGWSVFLQAKGFEGRGSE